MIRELALIVQRFSMRWHFTFIVELQLLIFILLFDLLFILSDQVLKLHAGLNVRRLVLYEESDDFFQAFPWVFFMVNYRRLVQTLVYLAISHAG